MRAIPYRSLIAVAVVATLAGCAMFGGPGLRYPWRKTEAERCVASGLVQPSAFIQPLSPIEGPATCGLIDPYKVSATAGGAVTFSQPVVMDCAMTVAADRWVRQVVGPASLAVYGQLVTQLSVAGAYNCRGRNSARSGKLSEHSFGNALDVTGFVLADGRRISVKRDWRGSPEDQRFLRMVHQGACEQFMTVIGPDGDAHHQDHLHLDLGRYGPSGRVHKSCS